MQHHDDRDLSPSDPAHAEAIDWWVANKAGPLSPEERAEFEAWLARDAANRSAYADIAGMYESARKVARRRKAARAVPPARKVWKAAAIGLAAACLALFVASDDLSLLLRADYRTGVGATRLVTLEDGSRIELDGASAIALDYGPNERRVALLAGEAWFQVAADSARPFVVEAAGGSVTALGTAFDVSTDGGKTRVAVGEHRVSVSSGGASVIVGAGQETGFERARAATSPVAVSNEYIGAWRRGALIVEDRPLGDVLSTLSRYRRGYVGCLTAQTCARRVSGVFETNEPQKALREIEYFLGLRAIRLTDYLVLLAE